MYRVVLYGLIALLVIAEALALTGGISISGGGLALSGVALLVSCYAANRLFAWLFQAAANTESWLITALILACILAPATTPGRVGAVALAGVVAMASKYLLVWRGSHIFNPAAFAAFGLSLAGIVPATWWVGSPWMAPFTIAVGVLVLRKLRKFTLFLAFGLAAGFMLLFVSCVLHNADIGDTVQAGILSWPIIFFGSIMLDEPITLPGTLYYQVLFAVLVGALFTSQLHVWQISTTPETALIIGNIFSLLFIPATGAMLRLRRLTRLAPDIFEAAFERPRQGFAFAPGQYAEWTLPHHHPDGRGNRRLFSMASAPDETDIRIAFRHYEKGSTFKNALLQLQPGNYIRAAHVAGNFTLPSDARAPIAFIAGGIGITPIRSMVQQLAATGEQRDMVLLYFASSEQDFVFANDFRAAEAHGLKTFFIVGRPETETLRQYVPDLAQRINYISGPDVLVTACRSMLRSLGVPGSHIRTDHFTGY
jgi:ferredoxin-NADP reductase